MDPKVPPTGGSVPDYLIHGSLSRIHSSRIELNSHRTAVAAALQPVNFATLTRVTNNASCNWVNLVPVSSVQFISPALNTPLESMG